MAPTAGPGIWGQSHLQAMILADAHSDLLMELVFFRSEERPFASRWLPALQAGGVQLQVCALFSDDPDLPELALRKALLGVGELDRAVAENPGVVAVRSAADLEAAFAPGQTGLMLSLEGMEPLGYEPRLIEVFCTLGVRMASLTWNRRNAFADGVAESPAGGLSRIGRALVDRMAELPMAFDLAHANQGTFFEVLERIGDRPVLTSHALCRALTDIPRNLSDDQLRALAERDGVVGLMALPFVTDPDEPTVGRLIDHVDHLAETIGIEHVCLGGDFVRQLELSGAFGVAEMALETELEGLAGPAEYPRLFEALRARGYAEADLRAIASENLLRVLRRTLPA
jgi:membrane dipeptidase